MNIPRKRRQNKKQTDKLAITETAAGWKGQIQAACLHTAIM
jgi:hypothetical protein